MEKPIKKDLTNMIMGDSYKLIKSLGAGAFGEIYKAQNNQNEVFAIKVERANCEFPQVFFEAKLYKYLHLDNASDRVLPKVYDSGNQGEYNFMVMDLLGRSLEDLFFQYKKFSLKTVCMLGFQMISRLEFLHSRFFIHRDVKPDNFVMGLGNMSQKVYLVDMGLAKRYVTKEGHIPYKENKSLTGTVRYASVNTHLGIEQSRRDDLESLGYVLAYLLKGTLPWMNIQTSNTKEKYSKVLQKKKQVTSEQLFLGAPQQFVDYMNIVKALKFEEKPDYDSLRNLFKVVSVKQNFNFDFRYEWTKTDIQSVSTTNIKIEKENIQQRPNDNIATLRINSNNLKDPNNDLPKQDQKFFMGTNPKIKENPAIRRSSNLTMDVKPAIISKSPIDTKKIEKQIDKGKSNIKQSDRKVDMSVKDKKINPKQPQPTRNDSKLAQIMRQTYQAPPKIAQSFEPYSKWQ